MTTYSPPKADLRMRSESVADQSMITRKRRGTLSLSVDSLAFFWEKDHDSRKEKEKEKEKVKEIGKEIGKEVGKEMGKEAGKEPGKEVFKEKPKEIVKLKEKSVWKEKKAKSEGSLIASIFSKKLIDKSVSQIEMKSVPTATPPTKSGSALNLVKSKPGYFGISLEDTMSLQKDRYPFSPIPVLLVKITEAIMLHDGFKTEGIFRVAGSSQQVAKLQQQFNDMNFGDVSTDPHVLVGVLKQWLRELKEPLIPNSIYYDCLQCESPEDTLQAIDKLPQLNKDTFGHLVLFLRELSRSEHQEFTKMNVHNLCLVSATVLFRCPSTDMAELMVNMQKEKVFLGLVLESSAFS